MSTAGIALDEPRSASSKVDARAYFFFSTIAFVIGILALAALSGTAPLGCSIVAVFLFAGPHNWFEARYMLARMPAKWGLLRPFFLTGILGTLGLTVAFAALPYFAYHWSFTSSTTLGSIALWNTFFIAWLTTLALLRAATPPRRAWDWLITAALLLVALNWLHPLAWSQALVFLHPLIALAFLERELARTRSSWLGTYRIGLAAVPLCVISLWWTLADAPELPGDDPLNLAIARHAGADIFAGVSSRCLTAIHVFLELLHYGAWIVAIPLATYRVWPWRVETVPLARRSHAWRRFALGIVLLGLAIVVILWGAFWGDYAATRDIYFTIAMLHVLAEAPFLMRLL